MDYNTYLSQLGNYREQINAIDHQLVDLLVKRLDVVVNVGKLKQQANQPVLDSKREKAVIDKIVQLANRDDYSKQLAIIYQCIMDQAKTLE